MRPHDVVEQRVWVGRTRVEDVARVLNPANRRDRPVSLSAFDLVEMIFHAWSDRGR
jgi:hypothetical protein